MCSLLWYPWAVDLQRNYQWSIFWGEHFWEMLYVVLATYFCPITFSSPFSSWLQSTALFKKRSSLKITMMHILWYSSLLWIDNSLCQYGIKLSRERSSRPPSRVSFRELWHEIKLIPLPEPRACSSASACSDSLSLTELTRLDKPKCLYGEKLARLREVPYHRKEWPCLAGYPFSRGDFVFHM